MVLCVTNAKYEHISLSHYQTESEGPIILYLNKPFKLSVCLIYCSLSTCDEDSSVLLKTLQFESHPLFDVFHTLGSVMSNRYRKPRCSTERYRRSFVPTAVKFLNDTSIDIAHPRNNV